MNQSRRAARAVGLLVAAAAAAVLVAPGQSAAQMPDVRQMAGIPMPMTDVPPGTVTVRVVRGDLTNNITGQTVDLHVGSQVQSIKTDAEGHATFAGLTPGAQVFATATVDGERLESQTFDVPAGSGTRLILVAGVGAGSGAGAGPRPAAPGGMPPVAAAPGSVSFGGQTRIQMEMDDVALQVFYILDLVNPSMTPVQPATEIAFDLPEAATQASMLEGSSPQAQVRGTHVTITGPFQPGTTLVQLAYTLPAAGPECTIRQQFPIQLDQVQVIVAKAGNLHMTSPQFGNQSDVNNAGHNFIMGTGPALPAGTELTLSLTGVPSRSHSWRYVGIGLVVLILLVGTWGVFGGPKDTAAAARRAELETRRERLLDDMVATEERRQAGTIDEAGYAKKHADLMAQLERVYGELDQGGPDDGNQGLAA